jgi:hypothetical protein
MFESKAGAYPRVEHLKGASLGPANIRLGWRGLPETNTLAYYGATAFSIMTLSITTLSIKGLFVTLGINDIQHKRHSITKVPLC